MPAKFQVIACGSRQRTFDMFCIALTQHVDDLVLLLVNAQQEVTQRIRDHLSSRVGDGWERPVGVRDNQAHLMVQVMESWFLADRHALAAYFGNDFRLSALPRPKDVERVPESEVLLALNNAAKDTLKKGYNKTRDGFVLLESIDPEKVRAASPYAERLFDTLKQYAA